MFLFDMIVEHATLGFWYAVVILQIINVRFKESRDQQKNKGHLKTNELLLVSEEMESVARI